MNLLSIRAGDIDVGYRLEGPAGSPVVLFAHALGVSHRMWDAQIPVLARSWRCLRYDWRGHGGTGLGRGPCSLGVLADDAIALLDALGISRVHWVGASAGAMIGQAAALAHPERIASLALCNSMGRAPDAYRALSRERLAIAAAEGMAGLWERTARMWFTEAFLGSEAVARLREAYLANPVAGFRQGLAAVGELDDLGRLDAIRVPTLIVAGSEDAATPVAASQALHHAIRDSTLVIIDGVAHLANVQAPERFNSVLAAFLDDADGEDGSRAA